MTITGSHHDTTSFLHLYSAFLAFLSVVFVILCLLRKVIQSKVHYALSIVSCPSTLSSILREHYQRYDHVRVRHEGTLVRSVGTHPYSLGDPRLLPC